MSAILALQPHPPVETVGLGDRAGELELRERRRDRGGVETALAHESVDATWLSFKCFEHAPRRLAELGRHGNCGFHAERFEHVLGRCEGRRAKPQQRVRTRRECRRDLARDSEDLAPRLEREVGGDQRAAPLAGLDDDRRNGETGDDPVAGWKPPGRGLDSGRVLGYDEAVLVLPRSRGELEMVTNRLRQDARP